LIGLERPLALTYDIHTNMSSSLLSADENTAAQVDLTESVVSTGLDWCHASDWRVVGLLKSWNSIRRIQTQSRQLQSFNLFDH